MCHEGKKKCLKSSAWTPWAARRDGASWRTMVPLYEARPGARAAALCNWTPHVASISLLHSPAAFFGAPALLTFTSCATRSAARVDFRQISATSDFELFTGSVFDDG